MDRMILASKVCDKAHRQYPWHKPVGSSLLKNLSRYNNSINKILLKVKLKTAPVTDFIVLQSDMVLEDSVLLPFNDKLVMFSSQLHRR